MTPSRRHFLKDTVAASAALAFPTIIPATALGKGGRPAPSERVTVGLMGFGTIAQFTSQNFLADARCQIVAVADPVTELSNYGYSGQWTGGRVPGKAMVETFYSERDDRGKDFKGCAIYESHEEMLAKEDLDALNISTPDHWHAKMCLDGAAAGKHMYGQKPLSLTVKQGRRMADAVKKAGITWQTGSQQRSDVYFRTACEFVRNGRLGKLQAIKIVLPGGHKDWSKQAEKVAPLPVPAGFNYDRWEGPAPHRDYRPALLPLQWRHNYDYSGGMVTDFGAHHFDIVQWALGMDESGPVKFTDIKATLPASSEIYNTATSFQFTYHYADGTPVHVSDDRSSTGSILFEGEDGKSILVTRDALTMTPNELRREKIQDDEIKLYESRGHVRNFLDCIYSGEPTVAPIEAAHRTVSIAHLANIGIRQGISSFDWDPAKEQSSNAKINAHLDREAREPYRF